MFWKPSPQLTLSTDALAGSSISEVDFVEEFGIEPTPALRELERAILTQDPSLDLEHAAPRSTAPGAASWSETVRPEAATTCAIPPPIWPAPTTSTCSNT